MKCHAYLLDYSDGIRTLQLSEHTSAGICPSLLNSIQKAREEESSIILASTLNFTYKNKT